MVVDRISPTLETYISLQNPDIDMNEIKEISPFSEEEIFKFKKFWTDIDK